MPYFIGTLAALDPSGRWAAIGTGVAGIGAAAIGRTVEANGYGSLGLLMLVMGLLAIAVITPVLLRLDRSATKAPSPDASHSKSTTNDS